MEDITANFTQEDINDTKGLSCLSYLGLLFLVPMLVNKDSAYTKFHVNQGVVIFIAEIALSILGMCKGFLRHIPAVGWLLSMLLGLCISAASIALTVFAVMGIVNALQGKAKKLPVIGNFELIK